MLRCAAAQMEMHDSENALLDAFVGAVHALDPDILVGFEVQQGSLGFLADRASVLERPDPLLRQLSRTPQVACCHMLCSRPRAGRHPSGLLPTSSSPPLPQQFTLSASGCSVWGTLFAEWPCHQKHAPWQGVIYLGLREPLL